MLEGFAFIWSLLFLPFVAWAQCFSCILLSSLPIHTDGVFSTLLPERGQLQLFWLSLRWNMKDWKIFQRQTPLAVYVSNNPSFLDLYTLLTLRSNFKFISKTSIFIYPIIGWAMLLLGVIPLKRMDTQSQLINKCLLNMMSPCSSVQYTIAILCDSVYVVMYKCQETVSVLAYSSRFVLLVQDTAGRDGYEECLKRCMNLINRGASVFFFPEATRSKDGRLGTFKKGAFSVAVKTGVPVVPITISGTGNIMPSGKEGILNYGAVKVVVHKGLTGTDAEVLCREARSVIADTLDRCAD